MTRTCSICTHPARPAITDLLVRRVPYRKIAQRFQVSETALSRHLNEHLADHVQKALSTYGERESVRVLDKLSHTMDRLDRFLDEAEESGDGREFVVVAAELRRELELAAKLQGVLDERPQVNVLISPVVQQVIIRVLDRFPEAKLAVADALREIEEVS